jgi:hypothetical protein
MQILEKRSSESVTYDIDCSLLLATGETITNVTSVTATPATTTPLAFGTPAVNSGAVTYTDAFGSTRTAAIGKVVQVQISGGSIPTGSQTQDFIIRAKVVTNMNPVVEATVRLRLNDTP